MKIKNIKAIEILDSRGHPTLKTFVQIEETVGWASVPAGASIGTHEAVELRDNEEDRFFGKGVKKAVYNVNYVIAPLLVEKEIKSLAEIDEIMISLDGSENKSKLGANTILSVSLAVARTVSFFQKKPLWQVLHENYFSKFSPAFPRLMINIINGGKHANWNFDIQEFMISPKSTSPSLSVRIASEVFHTLGKILKEEGYSTLVGDEGGYSPSLKNNRQPFEMIIKAINNANYKTGVDIDLGIDAAASEFFREGTYYLKKEGQPLSSSQLLDFYLDLSSEYPIYFFEDPFAQDDWEGFKKFTEKLNQINDYLVIGDDLYTTNPKRIEKGIKEKATNSVLIKPNQIGTLKETAVAINLAKSAGLKIVISHRSGETEDSFIADLSYACAADFLKSGSVCRSERLCKYNRLVEIECGF